MTNRYTLTLSDPARLRLGEANDCAVVALAIVCRVPYNKAHRTLERLGRVATNGVHTGVIPQAVEASGFRYQEHAWPRQPNGCRYTPKTLPAAFPTGYYLVFYRGHVAAMVNGVIEDWTRDRRTRVIGLHKIIKPCRRRS